MFAVDTNVFVYAANVDGPEHPPCVALVDGWRRQPLPWCTTWGVLYEFMRIVTHPRVLARPWAPASAWGFVEAILAAPRLQVLTETSRHPEVFGSLLRTVPHVSGNLLHDAHTAALMLEHGVSRIYTRDADFHRFPGLTVLDPLAPQ